MPYITREDGERFIIPSYRDVLIAKKPALLKREILLLSSNYGEYITLIKKSAAKYEVAFSPEPGALLGETVWHYFKSPQDLIYCEAIPNSTDAILVIVKAGSVYLDGSFPIDSIPEELIVFQTQQNNFEIYLYGDVSISQEPEDGKFSFAESSVKSFTILQKPIFQTIPLVRAFRLQLVNTVLKAQGIGVFPLKPVLISVIALALLWMGWEYVTTTKEPLPEVPIIGTTAPPFQSYITALHSPDPVSEVRTVYNYVMLLSSIPGWMIDKIEYSNSVLTAAVKSQGARTNLLIEWAARNRAKLEIKPDGFYLSITTLFGKRPTIREIYDLKSVIANLMDRISYVIPGNAIAISPMIKKENYSEVTITINFAGITPTTLNLLGQQLKSLPLVLNKIQLSVSDQAIAGTMVLTALGN